jgi:tRNA(Ile)-lysidine synthase
LKRLLNELHRADRANSFFKPDSSILIALSGGPDSVCLTLLINALRESKRLRVAVAHVNHGLRSSADRDEVWVRQFCEARKIPFYSARIRVAARALKERESVEEAARRARYEALIRIAHKNGFELLATGHTADDQAETVMMRLAGGCGLWGLAGIPTRRTASSGVSVIRPLLGIPKQDVLDALKRARVKFRTDSTNRSSQFLRNRVRFEALPLLRKRINPRIDSHLAELAADAGRWRSWAEGEALRFIHRHGARRSGKITFGSRAFEKLAEPLRAPVFIKIMELISGREQHLRREHFRQLETLLVEPGEGSCKLAHGAVVSAIGSGPARRIIWKSPVIR